MIEYELSLKELKRGYLLMIFFEKWKMTILGIISISGTLGSFIYAAVTKHYAAIFWTWLFLPIFGVVFYLFLTLIGSVNRSLSNLCRIHGRKALTYVLTEKDGIIRRFCKETRQSVEYKRSSISRVISIGNIVYVFRHSMHITYYKKTGEVVEFLKKKS